MTWRERIQAARERKARGERGFTEADLRVWNSCATCLVGETVTRIFGIPVGEEGYGYPVYRFGQVSDVALQAATYRALCRDDVEGLEDHLDAIEERALTLKREGV